MPAVHPTAVGLQPITQLSAQLADLADRVPLDTPVPTCGEWTMADLIWHVTEVQNFWAYAIAHRPEGPQNYEEPTRPADEALAGNFTRCTAKLVAALDGVDPGEHAWSWADEQTVAFTLRRQSHEILIHLIDGLLAAKQPLPSVDPLLAADGVHELFDVMLGAPDSFIVGSAEPAIAFESTDTEDRWCVTFATGDHTDSSSGKTVEVEALKPTTRAADVTIRGTALALDCWLWGRATDDAVSIARDTDGDTDGDIGDVSAGDVARRVRALVAETTQ